VIRDRTDRPDHANAPRALGLAWSGAAWPMISVKAPEGASSHDHALSGEEVLGDVLPDELGRAHHGRMAFDPI